MATISIATDRVQLIGDLEIPPGSRGVVAFAHGSGSSRTSPRNLRVAAALHHAGLGTLLFDLLSEAEALIDDETRHLRFDIPLLGRRMTAAIDWLSARHVEPIGLFGASTGAAAALVAAAARPRAVAAVVSRGGRPDLAADALSAVTAPTLLLVGSRDTEVLELNRRAAAAMRAPVQVVVVRGATHLFEEAGTLDAVITEATAFFVRHLSAAAERPATA